jgi:ABC-type dipeptide/oligopeptide/nickel transport system permease subunit
MSAPASASRRRRAGAMLRVFLGRGVVVSVSAALFLGFVVLALAADLIAPYDPNAQDLVGALAGASPEHWLGQDHLGRDILSRIIHGGRVSLAVSFLSGTFAALVGITLGLVAGYRGGRIGRALMGLTDVLISLPNLVLSLLLVAIFGGGLFSLVVAIGLGMVPTYIRMVNGVVLSLKQNDYILAARLVGQREAKILLRHLLPNTFPTLIVLYTINLGNGVLTESTLSYLGVGISPPTASWGSMIADVYPYLLSAPWLVAAPGLCIVLVIIAFNVIGDGLRDALDPRLRGKL